MQTLPTVYLGAARRYVGAVDLTDNAMLTAAQALYDYLNQNGCQQASLPVVSDFQAAWLAAGGTLPQDTGGRSPVDGYYGANTEGALRQVYPDAIAGCVGAAPSGGGGGSSGGGGGGLTVLPATNWLSLSSITSSMQMHPWLTALFLGAAVAVTYVNWGKMKRRHAGRRRHPRRTVRRRARRIARRGRGGRRRNPTHPEKSYAIQIKFGTSRRGWTYYRPAGKKNIWKHRRAAASVRATLSKKYGKSRTRIVVVS